MTRVLTAAGKRLQFDFETDELLRIELNCWDSEKFLIDGRRNFGQVQEKDVIMDSFMNFVPEYMSGRLKLIIQSLSINIQNLDASLYRLGLYNCHTKETVSRQISEAEKETENIGGLEALALEMCVLNINMAKQPRVVR